MLLSTSGVGPRLALAILSTLPPDDLLRAVRLKERSAFTRIPGVGPKKADRLMLELSGKLDAVHLPIFGGVSHPADVTGDVASALTHLGFGLAQAADAARAAFTAMPECNDVATLTRHALQSMSQKPKGTSAR